MFLGATQAKAVDGEEDEEGGEGGPKVEDGRGDVAGQLGGAKLYTNQRLHDDDGEGEPELGANLCAFTREGGLVQ